MSLSKPLRRPEPVEGSKPCRRDNLMMSAPLLHESWVVAALGLAVLSGVVGAMAGKAFGDILLLTHAISEP